MPPYSQLSQFLERRLPSSLRGTPELKSPLLAVSSSLPPITPMITGPIVSPSPTIVTPPPVAPNPYMDVSVAASVAQQAVATVLAEDDVEEEWKTPLRRKLLQEARDRYFPGATWKWLKVLHSYFLVHSQRY